MCVFWSCLILYHKVASSFHLIRIKFYASNCQSAFVCVVLDLFDMVILTRYRVNINIGKGNKNNTISYIKVSNNAYNEIVLLLFLRNIKEYCFIDYLVFPLQLQQ